VCDLRVAAATESTRYVRGRLGATALLCGGRLNCGAGGYDSEDSEPALRAHSALAAVEIGSEGGRDRGGPEGALSGLRTCG
jgi:hypothetical protein